MILADIADVLAGYLFRSKLEQEEGGAYGVVQMRDVAGDSRIDWGGLVRVSLGPVKESFLVKPGDILLKAKGSSHIAVMVDRDMRDVIASSHFFILRIRRDGVLPEYLTWYLNQKPAQQGIAQISVGTWMRHVTKEGISKLLVPIPDLATQRRIAHVNDLAGRERQLVNAIHERREALRNAVLLNAIRDRETGEE